jgi:excisionase family DNA binding protein
MNELPVVLTATQVAEWLQVSPATVRRMAETGVLRGVKVGKSWRFGESVLVRWLEESAA